MGRNNSIIHQTITYIEENLHEELTLKTIAKMAGFSKYHFHRMFLQEVSGSHPFNYKMSVDQKVFHRGKG